ncbi:MAG: TonB-dependent receptor [Desulfovibrio sp.]|uniref:TonB-dependent receptor n=1 Tax=Desulfovibrio sp. 7SRBS1 TaxID=3378064 RepID=UPI003B41262D
MLRRIVLVLLLVCSCTAPALAQDQAEAGKNKDTAAAASDVYTLGEVVVSDQSGVKEIALNNVVTEDEIIKSGAKNAAEALRFVPGVNLFYNRKGNANIAMQGFQQDRILTLIDGVPYYETKYGYLDLSSIPSSMISRIEVIKGASSVLYGPNAEGGVINIITKKGGDQPSLSLRGEMGDYGTNREVISGGGQKGIVNFWGTYEHKYSGGWNVSDSYDPVEATVSQRPGGSYNTVLQGKGKRDNSDYESNNVWLRLGLVPDEDTELFASYFYLDSQRGQPAMVDEAKVFPSHPAFTWFSRWGIYQDTGVDLAGRHRFGKQFQLRAKMFYHDHKDRYDSYLTNELDDKLAESTYKDNLIGGSLFADFDPVDWFALNAAFHYKRDEHKQNPDSDVDYATSRANTFSFALENTLRSGWGTDLVYGFSMDSYEVTKAQDYAGDKVTVIEVDTPSEETAFNPMLGITHTFGDGTRVYSSIAQKTRFPRLSDYFSTGGTNLNLKPEKNLNVTVGASRAFLDNKVDVSLAYFHNDIEDMIFSKDRNSPYENIGHATTQGVEAGIKYSPLERLNLYANYTFTHARNHSADRTSRYLQDVPENQVGLGFDWLIPVLDVDWTTNALYRANTVGRLPSNEGDDPEWLTDSFTVDTRLAKDLAPYLPHYVEKLEVYLEVKNIFDENYWDSDALPAQGRSFLVGMSAEF